MPESEVPQVETSPAPSVPADRPLDAGAHRSALLIVFLVVFIDLLGFGIVLPLLPLYADDLLKPLFPGENNAPLRGVLLGLLMSAYSFTQFFFAPFWGRISDRVGRRPLILLGLGGSVVFYSLFGVASDLGAAGRAAGPRERRRADRRLSQPRPAGREARGARRPGPRGGRCWR